MRGFPLCRCRRNLVLWSVQSVLHAFIDSHWAIAMDEPTVNNMANTILVFGVLSK